MCHICAQATIVETTLVCTNGISIAVNIALQSTNKKRLMCKMIGAGSLYVYIVMSYGYLCHARSLNYLRYLLRCVLKKVKLSKGSIVFTDKPCKVAVVLVPLSVIYTDSKKIK